MGRKKRSSQDRNHKENRIADTPLVAHVVHSFNVGGMENGVVNLINRTPPERYRHAVISLTGEIELASRIQRDDLELFQLAKREGKDLKVYLQLWQLLRRLRPDIVHTRNMATLEAQLPAALAGVRCRVHGEHGRDVGDLLGENRKYRRLRRLYRPLVHSFIALSQDLEDYLRQAVGVSERQLTRICNGVDVDRFHPPEDGRVPLPVTGFADSRSIIIGWIGRMEPVKAPLTLVRAFIRLLERRPEWRPMLRLVMIGEGSLYPQAQALLREAGVAELAWLPGQQEGIPELLRGLDLFVLPSLAEGISNTVLEALATGLPVVATRVGGNPELIAEGETGALIPPDDPEGLTQALETYVRDPSTRQAQGRNARIHAESEFSIDQMVARYLDLYDQLLARHTPAKNNTPSSQTTTFL